MVRVRSGVRALASSPGTPALSPLGLLSKKKALAGGSACSQLTPSQAPALVTPRLSGWGGRAE